MPKIFSSLLLFSLSFNLYAKIDFDALYENAEFLSEAQAPIPESSPKKMASQPKNHSRNHFGINAEALILNSGLNNLEYGDQVNYANIIENHKLYSLPRNYNVGVRGDLEAIFHAMDWGLKAQGFHYGSKNSQTLKGQGVAGNFLFLTYSSDLNSTDPLNAPLSFNSGIPYGSLINARSKGEYLINLNMGDLIFTKKLVNQKHFVFALDAGARYMNINQQLNVYNYAIGSSLTNNIKNQDKLSAWGLIMRAHNMFYFFKGFALDLSIAGACVYGAQKMQTSAVGNTISFENFDFTFGNTFNQYNHKVQTMVEFEAKLSYEKCFFDDAFCFQISAGYFLMDIFNSFDGIKVSYAALGGVETNARYQADTVLQGATAGLGIKF